MFRFLWKNFVQISLKKNCSKKSEQLFSKKSEQISFKEIWTIFFDYLKQQSPEELPPRWGWKIFPLLFFFNGCLYLFFYAGRTTDAFSRGLGPIYTKSYELNWPSRILPAQLPIQQCYLNTLVQHMSHYFIIERGVQLNQNVETVPKYQHYNQCSGGSRGTGKAKS